MEQQTPTYAETAVLVAVMDRDHGRARELLAEFLPNELRTFDRQLQMVRDLIARRQRKM